MTSQEPSGAVDSDFDDAAHDVRDRIESELDDFPTSIERGDIVIDLVKDRPLFVRGIEADSAVEYADGNGNFNLTTYKAHPWLPVTPDDTVFDCAFVPTTADKIPTDAEDQSYAYPEGRLARVPVEYLFDKETHRHDDFVFNILAGIIDAVDDAAVAEAVVVAAEDEYGETVGTGLFNYAGL